MQPAILSYGTQAENAVLFDRVCSNEMVSEYAVLLFVILIFLIAQILVISGATSLIAGLGLHFLCMPKENGSKRKGTNAKNHFKDVQPIWIGER